MGPCHHFVMEGFFFLPQSEKTWIVAAMVIIFHILSYVMCQALDVLYSNLIHQIKPDYSVLQEYRKDLYSVRRFGSRISRRPLLKLDVYRKTNCMLSPCVNLSLFVMKQGEDQTLYLKVQFQTPCFCIFFLLFFLKLNGE